jgi:hypothetical protein
MNAAFREECVRVRVRVQDFQNPCDRVRVRVLNANANAERMRSNANASKYENNKLNFNESGNID